MKASKEIQEQFRAALEGIDTEYWRTEYRAGRFHNADKTKDVNKRYRWDLLHSVPDSWRLTSACYDQGMNDSHIDTLLRSIVPAL